MVNDPVVKGLEVHHLMESIAFGLTDGMICFLGIIVGVAKATSSPVLVIIASIIGGIADALGNSVGFFVSQTTERAVQIHGVEEHGAETRIHSRREVLMSGVFSFLATIFALALLLSPFIFLDVWEATIVAFLFGTAMSFILGGYVGTLSKESPYKSGLKYAAITIAGALISYLIGDLLSAQFKA